jgi:hypothetical protein
VHYEPGRPPGDLLKIAPSTPGDRDPLRPAADAQALRIGAGHRQPISVRACRRAGC